MNETVTPETITDLLAHGQASGPVDENITYIIDPSGRVFADLKVVTGTLGDYARDLTIQGIQAKFGHGDAMTGALLGAGAKTTLAMKDAFDQMETVLSDAHAANALDPDNQG